MIIKLTDDNGSGPVLVNIRTVLTVETRGTGSVLIFPNGDKLQVKETLSEVEYFIREVE